MCDRLTTAGRGKCLCYDQRQIQGGIGVQPIQVVKKMLGRIIFKHDNYKNFNFMKVNFVNP